MQKFTNHLGWIDSASFNQIIAVGVWHSCFWVYINLLDLLLSTVRAFYIIFCQLEVNLARVNNLLQSTVMFCSLSHQFCGDTQAYVSW